MTYLMSNANQIILRLSKTLRFLGTARTGLKTAVVHISFTLTDEWRHIYVKVQFNCTASFLFIVLIYINGKLLKSCLDWKSEMSKTTEHITFNRIFSQD